MPKQGKHILPKLQKDYKKINKTSVKNVRSESEGKMNLSSILKDPHTFMESYFADINKKVR